MRTGSIFYPINEKNHRITSKDSRMHLKIVTFISELKFNKVGIVEFLNITTRIHNRHIHKTNINRCNINVNICRQINITLNDEKLDSFPLTRE